MRWAFYRESGNFLECDNSPSSDREHTTAFSAVGCETLDSPKISYFS